MTSILEFNSASARKQPEISYWNNKIDELNERAKLVQSTSGLKNGKMTGGLGFAWSVTEQAFLESALKGMLISGAMAFLVLVLSTCNIVIALYAIIGIGSVIVSVVGVMVFLGWELGMSESIAMVMLIGFSVDYVVHLANHYSESYSTNRHRRMQEAYG